MHRFHSCTQAGIFTARSHGDETWSFPDILTPTIYRLEAVEKEGGETLLVDVPRDRLCVDAAGERVVREDDLPVGTQPGQLQQRRQGFL